MEKQNQHARCSTNKGCALEKQSQHARYSTNEGCALEKQTIVRHLVSQCKVSFSYKFVVPATDGSIRLREIVI